MGASSRDLDDWATALNVDNDDDAQVEVMRLMKQAHLANETARLLARLLVDLPGGQCARLAVRYTDGISESLSYVEAGFDRHDRGNR